MKTINFSFLLVILLALTNCNKDENDEINVGLKFLHNDLETNTKSILVNYDEIQGYDSTKYAFVLDDLAWKRISDEINEANLYVYPFPDFVINITLNDNLIYRAGYVPSFSSSTADLGKIFFRLQEPDIIYFQTTEMFEGEDLRNDKRLIEQLKKDNKLIEIDN